MRQLPQILGLTIAIALLSSCAALKKEQPKPRAVITLTEEDIGNASGENQITRPAGIACIPGRRVEVEVEITGNVVPPPSDTLIGEALCKERQVAAAQVTAAPPIGFDANRDVGRQRTGTAACQASWTFMPNPNKPVWKVVCKFF